MILYSFDRAADNELNLLEDFVSKKHGHLASADAENKDSGDVCIVLEVVACQPC